MTNNCALNFHKDIPLKRNRLRFNEYYDIQTEFDRLYALSKNNQPFTNLMELILDRRNILLAYRTIKTNTGSGTAGVNGKTIEDWKVENQENYVEYVQNRLIDYMPHAVRRVEIPKDNGGIRPLGIPTIEDRLIQQSIKQIIEPIAEAKFHNHSYGFRPNRGARDAIARLNSLVNKGQNFYVVDIDIKGFFDNVNHGKLLKQLWNLGIQDKNLLSIISKMLKAEIQNIGTPEKGTPQGGILSPLLSNIVLNELDWWISNQWETIKTNHKYSHRHKYNALKKSSKLKECFIVRYADDFKILCKNKNTTNKIFHAVKLWLQERLSLEINTEKSKVINMKTESSEFLGFRFKVKKVGKKYVLYSHISEKSEGKIKTKLKEKIKKIQHKTTPKNVDCYNSAVLGMQNYYKAATHVSKDFAKLAFVLSKTIWNRTKNIQSKQEADKIILTKAYLKFYEGNYKKIPIAGIVLFPIAEVKQNIPMCFSQDKCNYTDEGRVKIHKARTGIDMRIVHYLMKNPVLGQSLEYNDNRLSLYSGQNGKCGISNEYLQIGKMAVHHKLPKKLGGDDKYSNLLYVTTNIHRLLHAKREKVIKYYLSLTNLDKNGLNKLNKMRKLIGNSIIE